MWSTGVAALRRAAASRRLAIPALWTEAAKPDAASGTGFSTNLVQQPAARPAWPSAIFAPASSPVRFAPLLGGLPSLAVGSVRMKQTKRQSYHKPARSAPFGQTMPKKAHIGLKALSAEYVEAGRVVVKQRKYIAKNPNVTRKKHFKLYPGVGVKVMKSTSLQAAVSGRVKITHDVARDVLIMNVLAEPREELLRDDMWRYRTEHVETMQENTLLCHLRSKALPLFGKEDGWVNPPSAVKPMRVRISERNDVWNNPLIKDPMEIEPFPYPMTYTMLSRHITKVRNKQAGVPDEENDPEFETTDTRLHLFRGQAAQR